MHDAKIWQLNVELKDVNDQKPEFEQLPEDYVAEIYEGSSSVFVMKVTATDVDSDPSFGTPSIRLQG